MIYIHVPFCRSFCTYCDFYSEIACRGKDTEVIEGWLAGIEAEIRARRDEIVGTEGVNTLYIGGGTPSVLPLSAFQRIVKALKDNAVCTDFQEFTVEVNPEDIVLKGESFVRGLLSLGVNRISMGVQSLDDATLRWMNRRHSSDGARKAFELLRLCGVKNISVDVIFGVNGMSDAALESSLNGILAWHPEHISAYQLSIEEGSALSSMIREGRYQEASDEACRAQYELICRKLKDSGYEHYEISNWALPGYRAVHNSAYWTRDPYVGLGPGAHSLTGLRRSWNSQNLSGWTSDGETLTDEQISQERLMLGLRTAEGVDGKRICESDWFIADSIIADLI